MGVITEKPSYGVIVGRFQVPELHDGHLELFRAVRNRHSRVIVFVGVTAVGTATKRNPLDFETRRRMIQARFPEFSVHPLKDKRTDEEWSKDLDRALASLALWGDITLYGARDSFIPKYSGRFTPRELVLERKMVSGEEIRAAMTNTIMESYDFRAGQIYALNNKRPHVDVTVDIAILHNGGVHLDGSTHLLLAEKPGFKGLRFVGGFADPIGDGLEEDAKREVMEETGLDISSLEYVSSRRIADWRYTAETDAIKSVLYAAWSMTLGGRAADDIEQVSWHKVWELDVKKLVPEHQQFFIDLLAWLKKKEGDNASKSATSN